jgi:hypothetical protein
MLAAASAVLLVALFALVVFLLLVVDRAGGRIDSQASAISALASGDSQLRAQVRSLGGTPNVPPPQVIISGIPGAAGPVGPGPSDAQVQGAVDDYLAAHPPVAAVSTQALTTVVAAYLTEHPPAPGPPPSDAQVATAVAAYMAANPAPSGPPGPQGSPGVGEQGPAGPAGTPGSAPAGWTWTDPSGTTYDCAQDGGTPAPHYACAARPSPSASPSQSPSPTDSTSPAPSVSPPAPATAAPTLAPSTAPPTGSPATTAASFTTLTSPAPQPAPTTPGPRSGLWLLSVPMLPGRRS